MKKNIQILIVSFALCLTNFVLGQTGQFPLKVDSLINKEYDENGDLLDSYLETFFYDENNQDTLLLYFERDLSTQEWLKDGKDVFRYDESGNVVEIDFYDSEQEEYVLFGTKLLGYDSENRLVFSSDYDVNENGDLQVRTKDEISYSTDGLTETQINFFYNSTTVDWDVDRKREITYNSNGLILKRLGFISDEGDFTLEDSTIYEYNAEGEQTLKEQYRDGIIQNKTSITYSMNGQVATNIDSTRDFVSGIFDFESKYVDTLSDEGDLLVTVNLEKDPETNEYFVSDKTNYKLDNNIKFEDVVYPYYYKDYEEEFVQKYDGFEEFYEENGELVLEEEEIFIFSSTLTSIKDKYDLQEVTIYPNPSNSVIKINAESKLELYKVYDIHGILVKEGNNELLDVSNLNSGVYTIKVNFLDKSYGISKFVVE